MSYYINKVLKENFESSKKRIINSLSSQGFGVLSEINIDEKIKEKLGKDFKKYTILGACNPEFAYKALQKEDKIGTLLPCSVIVKKVSEEETEIAAVNPVESMYPVNNKNLAEIADDVKKKLEDAVNKA